MSPAAPELPPQSHPPLAQHPSLSRDLWDASSETPTLLHSLQEARSVLSLATTDKYIFCGSQSQEIPVWDKQTFRLKDRLCGHTGAVLALAYAEDRRWLLSSSGDSTVRVWSTENLSPLYILSPQLHTGTGDLFSLAWCHTLQTVYIGCQNTSIQWHSFNSDDHVINASTTPSARRDPSSGTSTPSRKAHRFFDSYPQYERKPVDIFANNGRPSRDNSPHPDPTLPPHAYIDIPEDSVIESAHYGYVYCMALVEDEDGKTKLVTGGGDESVKLWNCSVPDGISEICAFECNSGAVFSLVAKDETVYAGCQDGSIKVLDLETKTIVRSIIGQESIDILSLSIVKSDLYACSANGSVQRFSPSFDCTASWKAHEGIVLSSIVTKGFSNEQLYLITGGNDDYIKVWGLDNSRPLEPVKHLTHGHTTDTLTFALSKFVSIPSVSSNSSNREDCRQAAIWLKKCFTQMGGTSALLAAGKDINPLVLATFSGLCTKTALKPRLLIYGHYDVIPAPSEGWDSDPFHMIGKNGHLYGRGVTDNKGPILAILCAVAQLLADRALEVDVVFLIEGEEECGSTGFRDTVQKHKKSIGHIDAILVSNSTWIAEDTPCITYGLRGVIHCAIEITSDSPDLHSGIEGGAVVEPLLDMVHLLASLTDSHHQVLIPGFYEHVRELTAEENLLYQQLESMIGRTATSWSSRWREPSMTIHTVEISGPKNSTVIPGTVKSQVSIRIVPDQDLDTVATSLAQYLHKSFEQLNSPNRFKVSIEHTADWWLGQLDGFWFQALEEAVQEEWGVKPLRIREGGSIPSVPYLEKEFNCHALHLPMGQSSDQAHLPNERILLDNLTRGKSVIERFLITIGNYFSTKHCTEL